MAEIPFLVKDLALILMVAGIVTLLFKKLKQPLVLGYIVAGFLVSPHMPYTMSVIDDNDIQTWADSSSLRVLFGASSFTMRRSMMSESTRVKRLFSNFCSSIWMAGTSSCPSSRSTL